uniref:U-box domain-containing protein n=1 Tax=Eutreptiella gymnastica TaxID=73025 RepID=A0A7S1N645_9EUGL|mmetsp:Transcript_123345/g.213833  ORF Transcript_123345/g.213833 Transcript_123345/m.213833 type:complete len:304 (+) Transcript_123345:90-1001(+)
MTPAGWLSLIALGLHWAVAWGGHNKPSNTSNTGCKCSSECDFTLLGMTKWCYVEARSCDVDGCLCRYWLLSKWDYCNEPNRFVGRDFYERQVGRLEDRLQSEHRELQRLKKELPGTSPTTADADTQADTWIDPWDTADAAHSAWFMPLVWASFLGWACLRQLRRPAPERAPLASGNPEPSAPPYWAVSSPPQAPPIRPELLQALQDAMEAGLLSIPNVFICPITHDIMDDPVLATDGHTYSREGIEGWLYRGHLTSPITNEPMPSALLIPNMALRSQIVGLASQAQHAQRNALPNPDGTQLAP